MHNYDYMEELQLKRSETHRIIPLLLLVSLLFGALALPAAAQTQALNPQDLNYASIEDVFMRESTDPMDMLKLIPQPPFPYSRTLADFSDEVFGYVEQYSRGETGVMEEVQFIIKNASLLFVSMGVTEPYDIQRDWLEVNYGIIYPDEEDEFTRAYTLILYSILNRGMEQVFADFINESNADDPTAKPMEAVKVPYGVTLEEGMTYVLKSAFSPEAQVDMEEVDTMEQFMYELIRALLKMRGYPVDQNTGNEDLQRYSKIMMAEMAGFEASIEDPDKTLDMQALRAFIKERYSINLPEGNMLDVMALEGTEAQAAALARLILETMILTAGGQYKNSMSMHELFGLALEHGYFELGEDFYSDVYQYRVKLTFQRSSLWFSAICYADLMEPPGKRDKVKIIVNGKEGKDRTPMEIPLDVKKAEQTMTVVVKYQDGKINQSKTYRFTIVQGSKPVPVGSGKVVEAPPVVTPPKTSSNGNAGANTYIPEVAGTPIVPNTTSPAAAQNGGAAGQQQAGAQSGFWNGVQNVLGNSDKAAEFVQEAETLGWQLWAGIGIVLLLAAAAAAYLIYFKKKNASAKSAKENRF